MVVTTALGRMAIDIPMCAMSANSLNDITHMSHLEALRNRHFGDFYILHTDRLATNGTGEMHMPMRVQAILLLSASIIDGLEQSMFHKKGKGTEQRTSIDRWQYSFQVGNGENVIEGEQRAPHQDTSRRRPDIVFGKECRNIHSFRTLANLNHRTFSR
jgi:hypothetical protein